MRTLTIEIKVPDDSSLARITDEEIGDILTTQLDLFKIRWHHVFASWRNDD